jgi:hypothetical protein
MGLKKLQLQATKLKRKGSRKQESASGCFLLRSGWILAEAGTGIEHEAPPTWLPYRRQEACLGRAKNRHHV